MYCQKCGKEIPEGGYCVYCGEKSTKKLNRNVLIGIAAGIGMVCVLAFIFLMPQRNDSELFLEYIQEGNMKDAHSLYQNNMEGNDKKVQEAHKIVAAEIDEVLEKYCMGEMSYDDAYKGIDKYSYIYSEGAESATGKLVSIKEAQETFAVAEKAYIEKDFRNAYYKYITIPEEGFKGDEAKEKAAECYAIVRDKIFAAAEEIAITGDYFSAIEYLESELDFYCEEDKSKAIGVMMDYKEQYVAKKKEEINTYLEVYDFDECYNVLKKMKSVMDETEALQLENRIESAHISYIAETVDVLLAERDIEGSLLLVNQASVMFTNNDDVKELKERVMEYLPVKLQDAFLFYEDLYRSKNIVAARKDMYQNEYGEAFLYKYPVWGSDIECKETYLLNGEYVHFTATITPDEECPQKKTNTTRFKIYGDDVVLFEATVSRDTKPQAIDIDVTGVEKLSIAFFGGSGGHYLLANPSLYKNY